MEFFPRTLAPETEVKTIQQDDATNHAEHTAGVPLTLQVAIPVPVLWGSVTTWPSQRPFQLMMLSIAAVTAVGIMAAVLPMSFERAAAVLRGDEVKAQGTGVMLAVLPEFSIICTAISAVAACLSTEESKKRVSRNIGIVSKVICFAVEFHLCLLLAWDVFGPPNVDRFVSLVLILFIALEFLVEKLAELERPGLGLLCEILMPVEVAFLGEFVGGDGIQGGDLIQFCVGGALFGKPLLLILLPCRGGAGGDDKWCRRPQNPWECLLLIVTMCCATVWVYVTFAGSLPSLLWALEFSGMLQDVVFALLHYSLTQ